MLEVKNLTFKVKENGIDRSIVEDISFTVENGEMLVITGPNGGGKSSLAKVLMGIEKADSGQIILDGEDISAYDIDHRANAGIGYAFQQPPRFKGMKVRDLLSIAAGKDLSHTEACGYLTRVGLCARDYIDRDVNTSLSGGEVKRIEIATILARRAELMIFDEPEAGIDLWSFARLTDTFQEIHDKKEATIIIISHQERIIRLADEIVLVADGTVKDRGPVERIYPKILADTVSSCDLLEVKGTC